MSSDLVKSFVEQMSGVIDRYLDSKLDLDHLSAGEINSNIMYLQEILNSQDNNEDLSTAMGLISQIIPYLYVARGHATSDVPRDIEYYNNITAAQNIFRKLKKIGRGPSIFDLFRIK